MSKSTRAFFFAFASMAALISYDARSDWATDSGKVMVSGYNVYAPNMIRDVNGTYFYYFGGQLTQGTTLDSIFVITSKDGKTWSAPKALFSGPDIIDRQSRRPGVHANDPSVSYTYNNISRTWQFTMFFTYTASENDQSLTQIYSAVSADGINWPLNLVVPLLTNGPSEPSVVNHVPTATDQSLWWVFYIDRTAADQIRMVKVGGDRLPVAGTNPRTIYQIPAGSPYNVISSVEAKFFNNQWQLFYNTWMPMILNGGVTTQGLDLRRISSRDMRNWVDSLIIEASKTSGQGSICAAMTPAVHTPDPKLTNYELHFAIVLRQASGECQIGFAPGANSLATVKYGMNQPRSFIRRPTVQQRSPAAN